MKKSTTPRKLSQIRIGIQLAQLDIRLDKLMVYSDYLNIDQRKLAELTANIHISKAHLMFGSEPCFLTDRAYKRTIRQAMNKIKDKTK